MSNTNDVPFDRHYNPSANAIPSDKQSITEDHLVGNLTGFGITVVVVGLAAYVFARYCCKPTKQGFSPSQAQEGSDVELHVWNNVPLRD